MAELTQETKTLITILHHQKLVSCLLRRVARELEERADKHDLSKFKDDEFGGFVEINCIAREHPYGSQEYRDSLKDNKTIDLHFSRNRHHPEYHANGVKDMNLIDLLEMVCDWASASMTYGNTKMEDVLEEQRKRFGLSDSQVELFRLIWQGLER
jgi:hypothetical protein